MLDGLDAYFFSSCLKVDQFFCLSSSSKLCVVHLSVYWLICVFICQSDSFDTSQWFVSVFMCGNLFLRLFVEIDGCDLHTFYSAGVISFFVLVCVTSANS
jgi:hypothetical protein